MSTIFNTFKVLFYLRKNYLNKEGKASIMIRITINGDMVQFSSKLDVEPKLWNTAKACIIGRSQEAQSINASLTNIRNSITNHYRQISDREISVTPEKVRNAFMGIVVNGESLMQIISVP